MQGYVESIVRRRQRMWQYALINLEERNSGDHPWRRRKHYRAGPRRLTGFDATSEIRPELDET
jgi:hypothetical protein